MAAEKPIHNKNDCYWKGLKIITDDVVDIEDHCDKNLGGDNHNDGNPKKTLGLWYHEMRTSWFMEKGKITLE